LWLVGRLALVPGSNVPGPLAAALDLAFLPAVGVAIGRPIVLSRSRRNYVMLAVLGVLFVANAAVHLAALGVVAPSWERDGSRAGTNVVVVLSALICGRVVPMFTRNATGSKRIVSSPVLDRAAIVAIAIFAALELAAPRAW